MALLWFNSGLSDEDRARLIELYYKLGGEKFVWPVDDYKANIGEFGFESLEEIDRLMRQPTKFRRPPK